MIYTHVVKDLRTAPTSPFDLLEEEERAAEIRWQSGRAAEAEERMKDET
jgi:hypothetical protein